MHRRYENLNIPIEVIRTLVVIAEAGSFSKAGAKLGLSQPAISAQIKRLQMLVGGSVFDRVPGGVALTDLGKLVVAQARKLLEANDQILLLAGAGAQPHALRVGIATIFIDAFCEIAAANRSIGQLRLHCSHSPNLASQLAEGYLDVACLLSPTNDLDSAVEWHENFVWACSPDFVLSPGKPIPLICRPGGLADQVMQTLEKSGSAYRIVFTSAEHHARKAAAAAGLGLITTPARFVQKPLMIARGHYLPPLAPVRAGLFVRRGVATRDLAPVIKGLQGLVPKENRQSAA